MQQCQTAACCLVALLWHADHQTELLDRALPGLSVPVPALINASVFHRAVRDNFKANKELSDPDHISERVDETLNYFTYRVRVINNRSEALHPSGHCLPVPFWAGPGVSLRHPVRPAEGCGAGQWRQAHHADYSQHRTP
ncbi:hypothetical protein HaLaN_07454 [Haematococcus lacustris]|uniref:Uncharacterized protein n=1 Tax=Haematococcus lacustris TaxID=44745 RepID=A0A699YNM6_HAELA|nr:hypothetical protein HaLaN_07454 [Haematococcus lacustris]